MILFINKMILLGKKNGCKYVENKLPLLRVLGFLKRLLSHRSVSPPLHKHFIFHHTDYYPVTEIVLLFCGCYT